MYQRFNILSQLATMNLPLPKFRGDIVSVMTDRNGKKVTITIKDVLYVPSLVCNLVSLGKLRQIASIDFNDTGDFLTLKNRDSSIDFIIVPGDSSLFGLAFPQHRHANSSELAFSIFSTKTDVSTFQLKNGVCLLLGNLHLVAAVSLLKANRKTFSNTLRLKRSLVANVSLWILFQLIPGVLVATIMQLLTWTISRVLNGAFS
jgi:hypothetical protein